MPISLRLSRHGTACAAIMAGTLLLTMSALAPTYAASQLVKIPLDVEADTVSTGTAQLLDAAALTKGKLEIDPTVPITVNQRVTVQDPSDSNTVTLQSAVQMTRDDRNGPRSVINASVDRTTVDRRTGYAVSEPSGSIQSSLDKPAEPVAHEGLQFKFPFDTKKLSYPYFDTTLRSSRAIDFVKETEIKGLPVYQFHQRIEPTSIGGAITLPAVNWGRTGTDSVSLKRFYGVTRDLWVEPVSGAIVQVRQHYNQHFGSDIDDPDPVTIIDVTTMLDEQTVDEQVERAVAYKRLIQWGTVYGPGIGAAAGFLLVAGGVYLGAMSSQRTPAKQKPLEEVTVTEEPVGVRDRVSSANT